MCYVLDDRLKLVLHSLKSSVHMRLAEEIPAVELPASHLGPRSLSVNMQMDC